jgi:hypothetical protein
VGKDRGKTEEIDLVTRLVSTGTKIKQLEALLGTSDLNEWETKFVRSIVEPDLVGRRELTDRQLEALDRLWGKHFA